MMPRLFDSEFQSTGTSLTNNDTIATSSDEIESALDFMSAGLIIDTCGEENDAGALNKWVQYVVLKITRYYLFEQLLQIPAGSITTFGAQQLLTDLDYFCNILSALGMSIDDSRASMAAELKALKIIQKVIECMASPPKGPDLLKSVWNRLSSDKKMDSAETTAPATEEIIRLLDNDDAGRRVFIQTLRLFRDQFI
jgi:hypothetical protein